MKKQKSKILTDFFSKFFRFFAIFLCFSLLLIGFFYKTRDDFSEKFLAKITNYRFSEADFLREKIIDLKVNNLKNYFQNIPGNEKFINDIEKISNIIDYQILEIENGIFINFSGNFIESDVLHPFFGFFSKENNKINKIFWGENGIGEILETQQENNLWKIKAKNIGKIPWVFEDVYQNFRNKNSISLQKLPKKEAVYPGEIGIFYADNEDALIKNNTRGFFIFLSREK